jgi:hypothetical protein
MWPRLRAEINPRYAQPATSPVHIAWEQQNQYTIILQFDVSPPSLHSLAIIASESNKEVIDFCASTFLSQIFFGDT